MTDSDAVYYVGTHAAAAAVGVKQTDVARLINGGWLATRRGGSTPKGGRPPHLIRRADLVDALARYDAYAAAAEKEKQRQKPPPPPPPRPVARRTRMTAKRRRKLKKMHKFLWGFGRRPR